MISRVSLIGMLVQRDTTSCDRNVSSCSIMIQAISLAKCFEFFMWCDVLPTIGGSRSDSDLDHCTLLTLYNPQ